MKNRLEFNEENLINLITEKDGIKKSIYYTGKPIDELFKYKNMWQKLKEWIEKDHDWNLERGNNDCALGQRWVLDKMQELEAEDEEN